MLLNYPAAGATIMLFIPSRGVGSRRLAACITVGEKGIYLGLRQSGRTITASSKCRVRKASKKNDTRNDDWLHNHISQ